MVIGVRRKTPRREAQGLNLQPGERLFPVTVVHRPTAWEPHPGVEPESSAWKAVVLAIELERQVLWSGCHSVPKPTRASGPNPWRDGGSSGWNRTSDNERTSAHSVEGAEVKVRPGV